MATAPPPIEPPSPRQRPQLEVDQSSDPQLEASVIHQRVIEAISDQAPQTAEEVADKVISIITEDIETYSGTVPHPRHAEHWERILPGAAHRILCLAEQRLAAAGEQARAEERVHLAELQHVENDSQRLANFKMGGLVAGLLLGLAMISGALYASLHGESALALALVGASTLGTIGYFVNSNWQNDSAKASDD